MTVDPAPAIAPSDMIEAVRTASAVIHRCCNALDVAIPTCPAWAMGDLVRHTGSVHRWATASMSTAEPTSFDVVQPPASDIADADLADWFADGATTVASTLSALDPAAPTWHPFPAEQRAGFWLRRLAHETVMHAVDATSTTSGHLPLDAALASDGIDEYLSVVLVRLMSSGRVSAPAGSIHLHCTDTAGEWLLTPTDDGIDLVREHAKGDAAIRGTAADLWLTMWGRRSIAGDLDIVGDTAVAQAWMAIGGN